MAGLLYEGTSEPRYTVASCLALNSRRHQPRRSPSDVGPPRVEHRIGTLDAKILVCLSGKMEAVRYVHSPVGECGSWREGHELGGGAETGAPACLISREKNRERAEQRQRAKVATPHREVMPEERTLKKSGSLLKLSFSPASATPTETARILWPLRCATRPHFGDKLLGVPSTIPIVHNTRRGYRAR